MVWGDEEDRGEMGWVLCCFSEGCDDRWMFLLLMMMVMLMRRKRK